MSSCRATNAKGTMTTKRSWNPKPYVKCTRCEVMRPPADCRLDIEDTTQTEHRIVCSDRATCERLKAARLELDAVKP